MKAIPTTLNIYWTDNVTIEERYFPSRNQAKQYAKCNGIANYQIISA